MKEFFQLRPDIHFLNHGSFGATPREVFTAYQNYQRELEVEPVQFMVKQGPELIEISKAALSTYLNVDKQDLIFVTNPSTGMNAVIKSLQLKEGDEILSTNHEYGAVDRTFDFYCKKWGSKLIKQAVPIPMESDAHFLEEFWNGLTDKTKVISISHITSQTALILPVKEICRKARELGIFVIVDGAHAPAFIDLDIGEIGADVYVGACHKWMMAPKGSSFMWCRKEVQDMIEPLIVSWGYEAQYPTESRYQDWHQYQGTRDFSAFLCIPECISFMEKHNWTAVRRASQDLLFDFHEELCKALNSHLLTKNPVHHLGQMCSFPIQTNNPAKLKEVLYEKYRIEIPIIDNVGPQVYLRVSIQAYNAEKDLEALLSGLIQLRKERLIC
jgi:isopenicillin-N epimerase